MKQLDHPFSMRGPSENRWLVALGVTGAQPAFRFVADEGLVSALSTGDNISGDHVVNTPLGGVRISKREELTAYGERAFRTVRVEGKVIARPQRHAAFLTEVIMAVTQLQPGSDEVYIAYARIAGGNYNSVAIHDVVEGDAGYARDLLAPL